MRPLRFSMLLALIVLSGCALLGSVGTATSRVAQMPVPVVLVSIDGFRPDYLDRGVTPNLNALAADGVRAEGMRPSFPSNTFPNHYSIVTGLRPDKHGIVENTMRDPEIPDATFQLGAREVMLDRRWWDGAEPVWVTAERRGLPTAVLFWGGAEVPIHGVRPSQSIRFDPLMPPDTRVDTVLNWIDVPPTTRPRFLTLYFNGVDIAGHAYGPYAPETNRAIAAVDSAIGRLRDGLRSRGIGANILIVSDHGMADAGADKLIPLDRLAPQGSYDLVYDGATAGFEAKPEKEAILAATLLAPHDHLRCWHKANIPARFHYGHNVRVPAYLCLADVGWAIQSTAAGMHGYDNDVPDMRATFLANGPDFKAGTRVGVFDNVDVYPLIMRLIRLKPLRNAGSSRSFKDVLVPAR